MENINTTLELDVIKVGGFFSWHFGIQNDSKTSCVPKQINLDLLLSSSWYGTLLTYLSPKMIDF